MSSDHQFYLALATLLAPILLVAVKQVQLGRLAAIQSRGLQRVERRADHHDHDHAAPISYG